MVKIYYYVRGNRVQSGGTIKQHYLKSSSRENIIEHLFLGELLKYSWRYDACSIAFAKPEVDNQGYDLISDQNGIIRHIQLKSSYKTAKIGKQKVHIALAEKPSGCVVWVFFDKESMDLGPFLFFGNAAGYRLPNLRNFKSAKHTKANEKGIKNKRPNIVEIPKCKFQKCERVPEIYRLLFKNTNKKKT